MLILWIRRRKAEKNNGHGEVKKQLFQDHDNDMKKFRALHHDTAVTNDALTLDSNSLVPVHKVKLAKNIQN